MLFHIATPQLERSNGSLICPVNSHNEILRSISPEQQRQNLKIQQSNQ